MTNSPWVPGKGMAGDVKPPAVSGDLAAFLKKHYPQKCWDPSLQEAHQHQRYAGMVALAEYLIQCHELQNALADGLEPDAERAR